MRTSSYCVEAVACCAVCKQKSVAVVVVAYSFLCSHYCLLTSLSDKVPMTDSLFELCPTFAGAVSVPKVRLPKVPTD